MEKQEATKNKDLTAEEMTAKAMKQQQKDMASEYAKSMAKQEANRVISRALPDEVNQLRWAGLRGIPVVGTIVQWLDNIKWFRSMFGGK